MVTTITEVLNIWNQIGVFSYVIPFLLIFAVVYAILKKTKILGDDNNGILAIIAVSIGLLSLQFDFVSEFFAVIFPRFGIGISIFLAVLIFVGFFIPKDDMKSYTPIGYVLAAGVIIWALSAWDQWNNYVGFGGWFSDNIWAVIVLGIIVAVVAVVAKSDKSSKPSSG